MVSDVQHARGWLRKGDSDRTAAVRVIDGGGPYDTACFHAQQAVEKYLKAALAILGGEIPKTHNLEDLAERVMNAAPGVTLPLDGIVTLTPFAVEMRYDFEFWPDAEAARAAMQVVESVRRQLLSAFPAIEHP